MAWSSLKAEPASHLRGYGNKWIKRLGGDLLNSGMEPHSIFIYTPFEGTSPWRHLWMVSNTEPYFPLHPTTIQGLG